MRPIILLGGLAAAFACCSGVALAQKSGGVLRIYHRDNPPSASIHEEATNSTVVPFMAVFNNLVLYDQNKPQNSPQDIVPDLARSWSWGADGKALTFKLQEGVKWHDGQPFTAKDVVCTFDLLTGKGEQKLRRNPRTSWYGNVDHVDAASESEVTVPLMKDVQSQAPQAVCELVPSNASTNLLVNREAPPFDNPELCRALALALDRKSFIDILAEGQGDIGGAMLPPPAGVWGMPPDVLATIPGYGPDVAKNRAAARAINQRLGYGPDKRLAIKVAARNIAGYRDPAIMLIDQLKEIGIDGELDPIETANWFPKLARKDYQIGLNNTGSGVDDPDQQFFENYGCGSERNYTGYCNTELEKQFVAQSEIADRDKRRHLVWDIDKQLQEDGARPIISHNRAATCMQLQVKGLTIMVNSQYNGWRMEDVWLER